MAVKVDPSLLKLSRIQIYRKAIKLWGNTSHARKWCRSIIYLQGM